MSAENEKLPMIDGALPDKAVLTRLQDWLFAPRKSVVALDERRQASLLAAFLLILAILTWVGGLIMIRERQFRLFEDPLALSMLAAAAVFTLCYFGSRTRFHRIAAGLTVAILSALPYAQLIMRPGLSLEGIPGILVWLILPLVVGGIFLSVGGVLVLTAANVAALAALPAVLPEANLADILSPLGLVTVVAAMILLSIRNRDFLEALRLSDYSSKNEELERSQSALAKEVEQRTRDLERRISQLRTAAEISRSLGAVLDIDQLFARVVDQIHDGFDLYYVGLFLKDEAGGFAVLKAGSGSAGQKMLREKHRLAIGGSSMIGWATANKQPRIALDVGQEAVHFNNPHLPYTRSEMALPIILGNEVLGALTIQSKEAQAFDENDIIVLKGIADSLATAINNATLFARLQASLEEIRTLHESYLSQAWKGQRRPAHDFEYSGQVAGEPTDPSFLATLEVPLTLREQVIGQLTLEANKSDWSAEETAFIEAVTTQAAIALENARLLEETKQRVEREKIVSEIANKIWGTTDIDTILRTSIRELGRMMNASEGIIQLKVQD